jgi:hypothetical protein
VGCNHRPCRLARDHKVEETGLEPAYSALSVLGNPLPAASYKPTRDFSPRVASQCIRNLRRFLTCAAAITLTASKFCGALPIALLPHVKLVTPHVKVVFLQGLEPRLISVLSTVPLPIGLKKHGANYENRTRVSCMASRCRKPLNQIRIGASGRSRTYKSLGLSKVSLPFLYKRMILEKTPRIFGTPSGTRTRKFLVLSEVSLPFLYQRIDPRDSRVMVSKVRI